MFYSIITVCFNDLEGLKNTHLSIKNQTFTDFEWIVVDGASSDGTDKWLDLLVEKSLKWSSEPDKGIFDAMNKGIEKSSGDYLIFMNASDQFNGNNVLADIHYHIGLQNSRPYFIYGDAIDVTSSSKTFLKLANPHTSINKTMFTSHQAMIFDRVFGLEHGILYPLEFRYTADYAYIAFYLKQINEHDRILKLNFPFCRFLLGGTNEIHRYEALKEDYQIRVKILKINILTAGLLYVLHLIHTFIKKNLPQFSNMLRYKNNNSTLLL